MKKWHLILKKENMLIIALLGILLFIIAIPIDKKESEEKQQVQNVLENHTEESVHEEFDYCYAMEDRIEAILSCMEGVGEVQVMVTVKSSGERIVEKDEPVTRNTITEKDGNGGSRSTNDSSFSYETVYETDENGKKVPYVVKQLEPEIEGITVVCKGGGNTYIQKNISDALVALFHIEAHKIKVVKMK